MRAIWLCARVGGGYVRHAITRRTAVFQGIDHGRHFNMMPCNIIGGTQGGGVGGTYTGQGGALGRRGGCQPGGPVTTGFARPGPPYPGAARHSFPPRLGVQHVWPEGRGADFTGERKEREQSNARDCL